MQIKYKQIKNFLYSRTCLIRHSLGQEKCVGLRRIPDYRVRFPLYDAHWDRKFVSDYAGSTNYIYSQ